MGGYSHVEKTLSICILSDLRERNWSLGAGKNYPLLELGSGLGFLATHLLTALPSIEYVALDFSSAMHTLAAQRLGLLAKNVQFIERSFRDEKWADDLGKFDVVVTLQAVHELRHKRHASKLHAQVKRILNTNGTYLVCDHFTGEGGMSNDQLYMSLIEQKAALRQAGFGHIREILVQDTLALHHAC